MADRPQTSTEQTPSLDQIKKDLRKRALAQRAEAAAASTGAAQRLRDHLMAIVPWPRGAAVSGYWPMRDEIDPLPALEALYERGHEAGLPVMPGKDQPLVFRRWMPESTLVDGGFGTRIPPEDAPRVVPRVLLVPLLAFDRDGYRLGYGGGFYDRTLAALRVDEPDTLAVGISYAGQEMDDLPHDTYDQPMDMIVTEHGAVALNLPASQRPGGL